jgi:hypothetical protein
MDLIYSINDLGSAVIKLTFAEWLGINEPAFFGFVGEHDLDEGLFVQHIPSLSSYALTVSLVKVSGVLYKLDGSQRKKAWLDGRLPGPDFLIARVFDMSDSDFLTLTTEAMAKRAQTMLAHDLVKAAYTELGLVLESDRLSGGYITEAIHIALRGRPRRLQDKRLAKEKENIDMKKAINVFRQELIVIDSLHPKVDVFFTGVLAGALIMLGLGKPIKDFLRRLNEGRGQERDGLIDPVESLLKAIHRHRVGRHSNNPRMVVDLCKKTVQAMASWLEGEQAVKYWRAKDLTGQDLMPFVQDLRRLKKINAERDL